MIPSDWAMISVYIWEDDWVVKVANIWASSLTDYFYPLIHTVHSIYSSTIFPGLLTLGSRRH